jgi:hypothetical protein
VTHRAGCQKATTELSLQNSQSLSHLHYPTDTRQLTSPQGEADGVSDGGMLLQALGGGGEFALRLVPHQRAAPFYQRTRTHTHISIHSQESDHLNQVNESIVDKACDTLGDLAICDDVEKNDAFTSIEQESQGDIGVADYNTSSDE